MNKITALVAVDYTTPNAKQDFVSSLRETGFGVLKNHPLNQSQVQAIYEQWRIFFSEERKNDFKVPDNGSGGFYPQSMSETAKGNTIKDLKEFFHFYSGDVCPDDLRPAVQAYYESAMTLAAELLQWIEDESPPEISFLYSQRLSDMIEGSRKHVLRILHYPPLSGEEEPAAIRAAGHEDINLITILPASNEPGLQVLAKDGSWLEVPCDFGNLIVNIGDMLQEASGGYFPSTTHRVVNPEGADKAIGRISLPLFCHPNPEVILSDRYTADSYLQERLRELRGENT
ncbi:MAG: 2OG-Fe(II) oxygenase family protein [Actinomycetota bacterium]|nr:2OG-Fe(II) oxygenase family protein [Actinomycetota bacterium]MDG1489188.1 2OG-Fe(II) oxygenase family protein [Actinomycetota bacterium]MDG2121048.1 2OG-Fe(II) oxygenase family protein [Actinomycetota bacterium]